MKLTRTLLIFAVGMGAAQAGQIGVTETCTQDGVVYQGACSFVYGTASISLGGLGTDTVNMDGLSNINSDGLAHSIIHDETVDLNTVGTGVGALKYSLFATADHGPFGFAYAVASIIGVDSCGEGSQEV